MGDLKILVPSISVDTEVLIMLVLSVIIQSPLAITPHYVFHQVKQMLSDTMQII